MTILAATDRSENSKAAMRLAAQLAERLHEPLVVFASLELWERDAPEILPTFEDVVVEPHERALVLVHEFVAEVLGDGIDVRVAIGHPPAEAILKAADDVKASMIVVGTTGQSKVTEAFFGSTVSALSRRTTRPLLAVPPDFEGLIMTILAPVDFSPCSAGALVYAGELASRLVAKLYVQHSTPFGPPAVAPPFVYIPDNPGDDISAARLRLKSLVERLGMAGRVERLLVNLGPPHPDIAHAVKKLDVDLVVMGTHGRTGVARFFLGSTAERTLRERLCPVLVVRGSDE